MMEMELAQWMVDQRAVSLVVLKAHQKVVQMAFQTVGKLAA